MTNISYDGHRISVVVITHNRYSYLLEAIASIASQTLVPAEIVVVDDGSRVPVQDQMQTDRFEVPGIPLHVIRIGDEGPAAARNAGVARTAGEVIAFLDDDDQWQPDYLERCLEQMHEASASCVVAWLTCFDGQRRWPGKRFPQDLTKVDLYVINNGFVGSNFLISRAAFDAVGGFDERLLGSEDKDFLIRVVDGSIPLTVLPEPLVLYRVHPRTQASGASSFHYMQVYGKAAFYAKYRRRMTPATRWRLKAQSSYFLLWGARSFRERLRGLIELPFSSALAKFFALVFRVNQKLVS